MKAPRMCSTNTQLMLQEQYETTFGIYDHNKVDADPLALARLHPSEDTSSGGAIEMRVEEFVTADVFKFTGLSLVDFFNCPREYCDIILRASRKRQEAEIKAMMAGNKPPPGGS